MPRDKRRLAEAGDEVSAKAAGAGETQAFPDTLDPHKRFACLLDEAEPYEVLGFRF